MLGNVVHAIHETNVGTKPIVSDELKPYLNKGLIKNPKITNIDKFIESGVKYFGDEFADLEHIGSMYTIRAVLKDRDHDDARPTLVKSEEDKVYSLFSGKIDTCVKGLGSLRDEFGLPEGVDPKSERGKLIQELQRVTAGSKEANEIAKELVDDVLSIGVTKDPFSPTRDLMREGQRRAVVRQIMLKDKRIKLPANEFDDLLYSRDLHQDRDWETTALR